MESTLETTRREWEDGNRRLQAAVGVVLEHLRRRDGQTYTLHELAAAYGDADRWVQEALVEAEPAPGWPARSTTVQEAAFYLYSRGAVDYRP